MQLGSLCCGGDIMVRTHNYKDFRVSLYEVSKQLTQEQLVQVHKKIVFDALRLLVVGTPVDLGNARANWQVTIGGPASGVLTGEDREGGRTIAKGFGKVSNLVPFQVVYITNNVEYIEVLDQGLFVPTDPGPSSDSRPGREGRVLVSSGYSTQAPAGIIDPALATLRVIPL